MVFRGGSRYLAIGALATFLGFAAGLFPSTAPTNPLARTSAEPELLLRAKPHTHVLRAIASTDGRQAVISELTPSDTGAVYLWRRGLGVHLIARQAASDGGLGVANGNTAYLCNSTELCIWNEKSHAVRHQHLACESRAGKPSRLNFVNMEADLRGFVVQCEAKYGGRNLFDEVYHDGRPMRTLSDALVWQVNEDGSRVWLFGGPTYIYANGHRLRVSGIKVAVAASPNLRFFLGASPHRSEGSVVFRIVDSVTGMMREWTVPGDPQLPPVEPLALSNDGTRVIFLSKGHAPCACAIEETNLSTGATTVLGTAGAGNELWSYREALSENQSDLFFDRVLQPHGPAELFVVHPSG